MVKLVMKLVVMVVAEVVVMVVVVVIDLGKKRTMTTTINTINNKKVPANTQLN